MKVKTLQIVWHGKQPVFSLDFHPAAGVKPEAGNGYLLATGGADNDVKMWEVNIQEEDGMPCVQHAGNLSAHSKSVNVVRFSPSGERVASGDDQGEILLWKPHQQGTNAIGEEESAKWKVDSVLRGHKEDVQDLSWSPDSMRLVSGSVDHYNIVWNVPGGKMERIYEDHTHYVQGVSWDPCGKYFASIGGDRCCRIYSRKSARHGERGGFPDFFCQQVMCKLEENGTSQEILHEDSPHESKEPIRKKPRQNLFHGDSLPSFFRRLAWSPEGSFLAVPTGIVRAQNARCPSSTVFVYARNHWKQPALHLPGVGTAVANIRFCPVLFRLQKDQSDEALFDMPYGIVFAAATLDTVIIYDTRRSSPVAVISAMHYAPITDLAWSPDGRCLAISSHDGYCSIVTFKSGELGEIIPPEDLPKQVLERIPMSLYEASQRKTSGCDVSTKEEFKPIASEDKESGAQFPHVECHEEVRECTPPVSEQVLQLQQTQCTRPMQEGKVPTSPPMEVQKEPRRIVPVMVLE